MRTYKYILFFMSLMLIVACKEQQKDTTIALNNTVVAPKASTIKERNITQDFKDYWYAGTAEITSYKLTQERYGELRDGTAVTVFVTEDFNPEKQVKADASRDGNIPVLKLNLTKKFNTGIYPYSIMTSAFNPVFNESHATKVVASVQEWCGQTYMQLNNHKEYDIEGRSYFESEGDVTYSIEKTWLEDELFNLIRLDPSNLPQGDIEIIPSFEYVRLRHKGGKAYKANAIVKKGKNISTYEINYPTAKRNLKIYFHSEFPFEIESWEETHANGMTTKSEKLKRMNTAYWGQNSNQYSVLRDSLGLK